MKKRGLSLLSAMSELGAGTRGSSLGLDALRIVASEQEDSFFLDHPLTTLSPDTTSLFRSIPQGRLKRGAAVVDFCTQLKEKVATMAAQNKTLFVFTGDHSSALGIAAGLRAAHPQKPLGVLWIDAHFDVHSPYTTPSGNTHGMPIAAMLGVDASPSRKHNTLCSEEEVAFWHQCLALYHPTETILDSRHLVYVGVRSYEPEEQEIIQQKSISNISVEQCRLLGVEHVSQRIRQQFEDCEQVYISFDVDSIDQKEICGTGTPVENGFSSKEVHALLLAVIQQLGEKVVCFEVTEINPALDIKNHTARTVFPILKDVAKHLTSS